MKMNGLKWEIYLFGVLVACGFVEPLCDRFPKNVVREDVNVSVFGAPTYFIPSSIYTVKVESKTAFMDFIITSQSERNEGSFQVLNDGDTSFADDCLNTLVSTNRRWKQQIQFLWSSPVSGCITLRAAVRTSNGWRQGDKTFCALAMDGNTNKPVAPTPKCCACNHAKYKIIFEGLWSPQTHPKDFPTSLWLTHFSDVIGASHNHNFTMWEPDGYATYGFKQLAEYGVVRELETELRNASMQLRSIIKAAGLWHPNLNGNTSAVFRVDPRRHLLSLASMFGPSPDWIVGVSGLDLCQADCTWLQEKIIDLYPYDAGTDNGITYMSVNAPNDPQEKIKRITTMYPEDPRSPFYDPTIKEMPPLARLYIEKEKEISKKCSDLTDMDLMEQVSLTENTEEDFRPECSVSSYSEWSQCSVTCGKGLRIRSRTYTDPMKAHQFKCDRQLISKEMCVADLPVCPGEEEEDEEIQRLAQPGECDVTPWSDWSECSVTCDIGFILRTRTFTNSSILVLKKCMHISTMEKEKCMMPPCYASHSVSKVSDDCKVSEWSEWSPCSATCGSGIRTRIRKLESLTHHCRSKTELKQTLPCKVNRDCKLNLKDAIELCNMEPQEGPCRGDFTKWAYVASKQMCIPFKYGGCRGNGNRFDSEQECHKSCKRLQNNVDVNVNSGSEGLLLHYDPVHLKGDDETIHLRNHDFLGIIKPVDCVVSAWSNWSACVPCPSGFRTKNRTVLVEPKYGGRQCPPLNKAIRCVMPSEFCF